jgi:predicted choloylglycine hydrolase
MADDGSAISSVEFAEPNTTPKRRIRRVDWVKILSILDSKPGEWAKIDEFDQSVRSHIRSGRYSYIDPTLYEAVTERIAGKPRSRGMLFMRRRENS